MQYDTARYSMIQYNKAQYTMLCQYDMARYKCLLVMRVFTQKLYGYADSQQRDMQDGITTQPVT